MGAMQWKRRGFLATCAGGLLSGYRPARSLAGAKPDGNSRFRAGAAQICITPELGVSLRGYFMDNGPILAVHDDLFARALVLDDGRERIALVVCDLTVVAGEVFDAAKARIADEVGIPADRVTMSATHTHSAPRVGVAKGEKDLRYVDRLVDCLVQVVTKAVANLAPAKIGAGSGQLPQFVFNRRWYMRPGTIPADPFGEKTDQVRFNPPAGNPDLVKPAGPVDPEVSILSVQHADGTPLAVLANYSMHYAGGFKSGDVSADYFGVFSRRLGEMLPAAADKPPVVVMMTNGTSGNIGAGFDFRQKRKAMAKYEHMQDVGLAMVDEVAGALANIQYRDDATMKMIEETIDVGVRRPSDERLAWAKKIVAEPNKKYPHRWTPNYAREAVYLADWPAVVPVRLQAIRVGETLIGAVPSEVFCETGLAVKRQSPSEHTFVVELANQYYGYLPTPKQHTLGGYETWTARSSSLEVEAESKIRGKLIELIGRVAARD